MPDTMRDLIREHVAAFNAHDTSRVLAGLASDAVWTTGQDTFRGIDQLTDVFDDWLWSLCPALSVRTLVVEADVAAVELDESLVQDGIARQFRIAGFFTASVGLITRVTIYREGSADLDP